MARIALLEPFFGGSHRAWAEGLAAHSSHEVELLTLSAHNWRWRLSQGSVTLARRFREQEVKADLLLATSMVDLGKFLSITRKETAVLPVALYFHENQLTYPLTDWANAVDDRHYALAQFSSCLAADVVLFNSQFHQDSFLSGLEVFMSRFPKPQEKVGIEEIARKSQVLQVGLELSEFLESAQKKVNSTPVILWNHRWEHDKNPQAFFEALYRLAAEGLAFDLIVCGEQYASEPEVFAKAKERLADRILHWGYAESRAEYLSLMQRADILPVTSAQEFFGISVAEAIAAGCVPLLPNRLVYPELWGSDFLYETDDNLLSRLRTLLADWPKRPDTSALQECARSFDWSRMAPQYDAMLGRLLS